MVDNSYGWCIDEGVTQLETSNENKGEFEGFYIKRLKDFNELNKSFYNKQKGDKESTREL